MMGKRVYKTYVDLSNIIVRISDGTPEGKEHAVLFNAHLDSTLPSPGAADDAFSVGIMLDCMRVLVETPDWSPKHAIIFREFTFSFCRDHSDSFAVFNHAEESLQDGSHLFSTQHPIASTYVLLYPLPLYFQFNPNFSVRAAVNLEGRPLFSSDISAYWVLYSCRLKWARNFVPGNIWANDRSLFTYTKVCVLIYPNILSIYNPTRPYGTIFANDIFSTGIILSEYVPVHPLGSCIVNKRVFSLFQHRFPPIRTISQCYRTWRE